MKILGIIDEDFVNYKEPCMVIEFPYCDFKCDKENGNQICQNYMLSKEPTINIPVDVITRLYCNNDITKAIVFQGLEPFDSDACDMIDLISSLRVQTNDPIIIYTGYNKDEVNLEYLKAFKFENIIIKWGRYIPNQKLHYDEILGVKLASDNQYAEVIC
jgi:hypothetical protein